MTVDTKLLKVVEDKIIFAERLASIMQDSFTKKEFVAAFEQVIKIFLALKENNTKEMSSFREEYETAKKTMGKEHHQMITMLETKLNASLAEKLSLIDARLRELKDGEDGEDGKDADEDKILQDVLARISIPKIEEIEQDLPKLGDRIRDGLELLPEGEKLRIEAIEGLQKILDELRQIRAQRFGSGGTSSMGVAAAMSNIVKKETPTGDIDGVNLSYTVTKPINAVLSFAINGMVIMDSEYTIAGRTITFTTAIPSAYSGQTFRIVYV